MQKLLIHYVAIIACSTAQLTFAQDDYQLGPDSERHEGVPRGTVTKRSWTSRIFDGTQRDYWVYVPAQYDPAPPACVMVFQDGGTYVNETGEFRVPLANQEMAASLKFAKYDYRFEYGTGGHNGKHGGAILPDSLRWLWRNSSGELKNN